MKSFKKNKVFVGLDAAFFAFMGNRTSGDSQYVAPNQM